MSDKEIYDNFIIDPTEYLNLSVVDEMKKQTTVLNIEEKSKKEFFTLLIELQNWRDLWKNLNTCDSLKDSNSSKESDKIMNIEDIKL